MKYGRGCVAIRMVVTAAVGLCVIGSTACSEDIPTDYSAAHRDAFLAACSRPIDDPRLLSDICGCVYDRIEDELPFYEFQRIDERLAASTSAAAGVETDTSAASGTPTSIAGGDLPATITHMVADCFVVEADL